MPSAHERIQGTRPRIQETRRPSPGGWMLLGIALISLLACETPSEIEDPENAAPSAPSDPTPAHNAVGVPIQPALMLGWMGGDDADGDPVVFDVYIGSIEPLLHIGTTAEHDFEVSPQTVTPLSEVQWRVVARDSRGASTSSATWRFGTGDTNQPPAPLASPVPADEDTSIAVDVILRWSGGEDPEGGPTRFTLHLDTSPALESATLQIESDILEREFDPDGELDRGTTYYWRITALDSLSATRVSPIYRFTTGPNRAPPPPTAPEPDDGEVDVPIEITLAFDPGIDPDGDRLSYDIHFGTENPPPFIGNRTDPRFDPPADLAPATHYVWQVMTRDERSGPVPGPVWGFTTEGLNESPAAPHDPDPANGATGMTVDVVMSWQPGGDPDGDPVTFDIYFGTADPPPFAANRGTPSYDPPGDLAPSTVYYWRVVELDSEGGKTSGGTWSFLTAN